MDEETQDLNTSGGPSRDSGSGGGDPSPGYFDGEGPQDELVDGQRVHTSERERAIARAAAEGRTAREVAQLLGISVSDAYCALADGNVREWMQSRLAQRGDLSLDRSFDKLSEALDATRFVKDGKESYAERPDSENRLRAVRLLEEMRGTIGPHSRSSSAPQTGGSFTLPEDFANATAEALFEHLLAYKNKVMGGS